FQDIKEQLPISDKKKMQDFIREYYSKVLPRIKQADELLVKLRAAPTAITREDHERIAKVAKDLQSPDLDFILEGWQEEIKRLYGERIESLRRSVAGVQKSHHWPEEVEMNGLKSNFETFES